jgi:hypothetical protein
VATFSSMRGLDWVGRYTLGEKRQPGGVAVYQKSRREAWRRDRPWRRSDLDSANSKKLSVGRHHHAQETMAPAAVAQSSSTLSLIHDACPTVHNGPHCRPFSANSQTSSTMPQATSTTAMKKKTIPQTMSGRSCYPQGPSQHPSPHSSTVSQPSSMTE